MLIDTHQREPLQFPILAASVGKEMTDESASLEFGGFLPLSEFARDGQANTFTYRLRLSGLWFEQVRISADGTGSRGQVQLAPNLDAAWRTQFERDRGAVLASCLAP